MNNIPIIKGRGVLINVEFFMKKIESITELKRNQTILVLEKQKNKTTKVLGIDNILNISKDGKYEYVSASHQLTRQGNLEKYFKNHNIEVYVSEATLDSYSNSNLTGQLIHFRKILDAIYGDCVGDLIWTSFNKKVRGCFYYRRLFVDFMKYNNVFLSKVTGELYFGDKDFSQNYITRLIKKATKLLTESEMMNEVKTNRVGSSLRI